MWNLWDGEFLKIGSCAAHWDCDKIHALPHCYHFLAQHSPLDSLVLPKGMTVSDLYIGSACTVSGIKTC